MKRFNGQVMMKIFIAVGLIFIFPASTYLVFAYPSSGAVTKNGSSTQTDTSQGDKHVHPISKKEISNAANQFMDILIQKADENYKVLEVDSKRALLDKLSTVATKGAANEFVNYYYEEKRDSLYIKPTETPPWFVDENTYSLKELNEKHYSVVQQNKTELFGSYIIRLDFEWIQGKWKITSVAYD